MGRKSMVITGANGRLKRGRTLLATTDSVNRYAVNDVVLSKLQFVDGYSLENLNNSTLEVLSDEGRVILRVPVAQVMQNTDGTFSVTKKLS